MKKLLALSLASLLAGLPAPAQDEPPVAKAIPISQRDVTTQLQIFLDQQLFGPGKIDGEPGEFLTKALVRYQRSQGLPETGKLDENIALDSVFPVYTTYTIKEGDLKFIGEVPKEPKDQATKKYLPYTDLLEFLTERYHCSPNFLARINAGLNLNALKPGDIVRVPNVEAFKIEELPKTPGNLPELPQFKNRVININRAQRMLEVMDGEKLIAAVPITPGSGSGSTQTPPGTWKILGIAAMPTFRWDDGVLNHGVRTAKFYNIPIGPNNPVGVAWIGLNKPGIGIHGTNSPQTIGRSASHGCMRTANWDAVRLSKLVTKGVVVNIQ